MADDYGSGGGYGQALSAIGGFASGRKKRQFEKRRHRAIMGIYASLGQQQNAAFAQAMLKAKAGMQAIEGGYKQAAGSLSQSAVSSKQMAARGGLQDLASTNQTMTNRGLYNTTAAEGAARQVSAQTRATQAMIDQSLAGAMSQLQVNAALAKQNALNQLGSLDLSKYGAAESLGLSKAGYLQNRPNTGYSAFGDISSALGKMLSSSSGQMASQQGSQPYGPPAPGASGGADIMSILRFMFGG